MRGAYFLAWIPLSGIEDRRAFGREIVNREIFIREEVIDSHL